MRPASVIHFSSRVLVVSLLLLLSATSAQAQNETSNWIFGNQAWLKFPLGPGSPASLGGAVLNQGEGSASISDQAGNLLFSTDGRTVWNRNNVPMPNGSGLLGADSATHSALIVPWPDTGCKKYFIFTVEDTAPGRSQQLHYSVVDMNAAAGLGDVITANVFLKKGVSEKLAAVADSSGTGFWVVAHGFIQPSGPPGSTQANPPENREFYAYHVTAGGVSPTPVTSPAGAPHQNAGGPQIAVPSAGQMKISPNGQLIACAVNTAFVEILHFNASSGQVTPPVTNFSAASPPFQQPSVYGLEFSSQSTFLYVTTITPPSWLFQYEISSAMWTVLASGTPSSTGYDLAQLQLGPDKKIYVARDGVNLLGVIGSPDSSGSSCNFQSNGLLLSSGASTAGLPTMIGGQFSCDPGATITPTPTPAATPMPNPTPTPTATPTPGTSPSPTPTVTSPTDPCCPPWNSAIWAGVVIFALLLFRAPITRFLGR